jgi:hypothetical protein
LILKILTITLMLMLTVTIVLTLVASFLQVENEAKRIPDPKRKCDLILKILTITLMLMLTVTSNSITASNMTGQVPHTDTKSCQA